MAVQKSRKTPSKRGMHRSHSALAAPARFHRPEERRNPFPSSDFARRILSRPQGARDQGGHRSREGRRIKPTTPGGRSAVGPPSTHPVAAPLHIAIDAMSGDRGPSICVPAAIAASLRISATCGSRWSAGRPISTARASRSRTCRTSRACIADQVVEMTDHPREALRRKKDSSMRRALDLVKARRRRCLRERGQHGRAHGDGAFRAQDAAGRRASGDRVA